ncbi:MAG: hypothetical protein FWC68_04200, partial [Oscillospiraceae bacterium]|nr:hypothetical protein [Oscillospiraceae bacterium]
FDTWYEMLGYALQIGVGIIGNAVNHYRAPPGTLFIASDPIAGREVQSIAGQLQSTIATWYVTLRAIAFVGLLSVLVYTGIKILTTSIAEDSAKYKQMLMNWLTAMCLLFVMHYIMVFILTIINSINLLFTNNIEIIGTYGQDILMTDIRNYFGESEAFGQIGAYAIMYLVLVIWTVTFTIQYIKRVLYIALFTMIAPLVALTYPIDKMKGGQAEAFNTWFREYMYNALLQVVHLLLYFIFVASAMELVRDNPLYAIVAIGFMIPAQKFIRKMFGFDKAETAGGSTAMAAAGGAMVMKAVNSRRGMGRGANKTGANKTSGTRTASKRSYGANASNAQQQRRAGQQPAAQQQATARQQPATQPQYAQPQQQQPTAQQQNMQQRTGVQQATAGQQPTMQQQTGQQQVSGQNQQPTTRQQRTGQNQTTGQQPRRQALNIQPREPSKGKRMLSGVRNTVGKRFTGKNIGRRVAGTALGASIASAKMIGAVSVAAATGKTDPLMKGGMAAIWGFKQGQGLVNRGANFTGNVSDRFLSGYRGSEEHKNKKLDKEYFGSDEWKHGASNHISRERAQEWRDIGEVDTNKMLRMDAAGVSPEAYQTYKDIGVGSERDIINYTSNNIPAGNVQAFHDMGITGAPTVTSLHNANVTPEMASQYEEAGFSSADMAKLGKAQIDPGTAGGYATAGVTKASDVKNMVKLGVDPNDAIKGLKMTEAIRKQSLTEWQQNPDAVKNKNTSIPKDHPLYKVVHDALDIK